MSNGGEREEREGEGEGGGGGGRLEAIEEQSARYGLANLTPFENVEKSSFGSHPGTNIGWM